MSKKIENEVVETVETTETEVVKESKLKTIGGKVVTGVKTHGPKVVKGALLFGAGLIAGKALINKKSECEDFCGYVDEDAEPDTEDFADEEA